MSDIKGMKMPRGNKDDIIRYAVPVPPMEVQRQIVAAISAREAKIAEARAVIDGGAGRKQAILDNYLG